MSVSHRVRALLINDQDELVLIKRVRAGAEPYWTAPGGGVEDTDQSLDAALHREIRQEMGGEIRIEKLLLARTFQLDEERLVRQYFYLCRLQKYDLSARSGPEFEDPDRGEYHVEAYPLDPAVLRRLNIRPDDLKAFLIAHATELFDMPGAEPD